MPTLREHAAARRSQTLSRVDVSTFEHGLARTYDAVAQDCWGGFTPTDDEYVSVILDRLEAHGGLTPDELATFRMLPLATKRQLALNVGP